MSDDADAPLRVLYSFPHRLGAGRICHTAWQQVDGLAAAGADVLACPGSLERPLSARVRVLPTLARGPFRLPYRALGSRRTFALHDHIVSRRLERLAGRVDIVHTWPQGALRTLAVAARLGIPTVLERPNAHTRYAYEVVGRECDRIGVPLPPGHEHAYDADVLRVEEAEFDRAYRLLCPSDFVARTFVDKGFAPSRLLRTFYGFDADSYHPPAVPRPDGGGLRALFVGVCAVRKGLHFALQAWLQSTACRHGTLSIAGAFIPAYRNHLAPLLAHPSIEVLGHRNDIADWMRRSDVLLLPSLEEGSALACNEAIASGCVPLVSDAGSSHCRHRKNALVHRVGDVASLTRHLNGLDADRAELQRLRENGLELAPHITWPAAAHQLLDVYRRTIRDFHQRETQPAERPRVTEPAG